ncbi:NAD(P)-dependent oxidoreductase [Actinophytocola sp.]|uniref:NAD(P)-dependent oxidoreductase n=1 Tax=Actinophytocola sp. TaxID=1872138 RepID=UPI002ED0E1D2
MNNPPVGVIGLGAMGHAVAERLCYQGVSVVATSHDAGSRQKFAHHPSISTRPNPAGVVSELAGGEGMTVLVCVPAGERVTDVVFGPDGLLDGLPRDAELLVIDLSVVAPTVATEMAAALGARGHRYVDAPAAGGPAGASTGTLSIMAGGEPEDIDAAMPWLNLLGRVSRCGPPGAGQVVGVCHQVLVASGIMAVAEVLALAERSGVDPEVARSALIQGYQSSGASRESGPQGLESLARDVGIAQRLAARAGLPSPIVDATNAVVRRLTGLDIDHAAAQVN